MRLRGLAALGVLLAAARPGEAADAAAPAPRLLDVRVLDAEGRAVAGLAPDDFEVVAGEQPVPLLAFGAHAGGPAQAHPKHPGVATPGSDDSRLLVVVWIDGRSTSPAARARLLPDLVRPLEKLAGRGARIAALYAADEVESLRGFDGAGFALAAALDAAARRPAAGRTAARRAAIRSIHRAAGAADALEIARFEARDAFSEAGRQVADLELLVLALAPIPGRKAVLLVSGGIPLLPAETSFHAAAARAGETSLTEPFRWSLIPLAEQVFRSAAAARVSFNALQVPPHPGDAPPERDEALRRLDAIESAGLEVGLQMFARETGGRFRMHDDPVAPSVGALIEDLGQSYVLGAAEPERPEALRRLRVRLVSRPALRPFLAPPAAPASSERLLQMAVPAAALVPVADDPLAVRIELGEPVADPAGSHYLVAMRTKIPLGSIAFDGGAPASASLRLFYSAADLALASASATQSLPAPIRLPPEELATRLATGEFHELGVTLRMRRGRMRVAVGVLDERSGRRAIRVRELEVR